MTQDDDDVVTAFREGRTPPGMHRDRLLLLTTTGRMSGRRHTTPMMRLALPDADHVVASGNASPHHPGWYLDVLHDPDVHVEFANGEYDAVAHVLGADERDNAWNFILQCAPFFADHQRHVERVIPIIRLERTPLVLPFSDPLPAVSRR
ncbi:nitroreductase/quinone reductase family protein [Agromyces seonyuensis]|uniref:Nitroreductase family deazaflavin-dependent oxidoreductase n=1 Tax=Agromyces seonyuensis TaxID=2662446 RepID=A0A6I4P089_9MICO|nr:nitroreductase/quinone reductase family protein [Agromyces seonyuensis]MWB99801.1 nitroreductase family deazaflavin-dependent oxidoreductase [Agromyces seonyuensis]